jgi:hypothetical protein
MIYDLGFRKQDYERDKTERKGVRGKETGEKGDVWGCGTRKKGERRVYCWL